MTLLVFLVSALTSFSAVAQDFALKTNILYDATSTINVGCEIGIAPKWTMDVSGNYNAWDMSRDRMWRHAFIQPEARYWLCDRFSGHFIAAHLHSGIYNISNIEQLKGYRLQGWFAGAGVGYGYALILNRHWNMEFELGVGYAYTCSDKFECQQCGSMIYDDRPYHYVGPTKAAISFVYLF